MLREKFYRNVQRGHGMRNVKMIHRFVYVLYVLNMVDNI